MSATTPILSPSGLTSSIDTSEYVARVVKASRAPATTDRKFPSGTIWVDKVGQDAYVLIGIFSNSALWKAIS